MFQKQFQIISINHRRHGYHISCRHTRLYNQNRKETYLELDFRLLTEAKDSPLPIRDSLARATGTAAIAPWIVRAGPPMWIIMPEQYVSPPIGASMSQRMTPSDPDRPIKPRRLATATTT